MPKGHAKKNANVVYMATTADQYELPVAIAETSYELDRMLGRAQGWATCMIARNKRRQQRTCGGKNYLHVYRIEIEV